MNLSLCQVTFRCGLCFSDLKEWPVSENPQSRWWVGKSRPTVRIHALPTDEEWRRRSKSSSYFPSNPGLDDLPRRLTKEPNNVASREVIDRQTPNPDVCIANGMNAMVLDQRLFISFNP